MARLENTCDRNSIMVPDRACVRSGQDVPFVSVLGQKGVMEGRAQHDKTVGYVVIAGSVFHVCLLHDRYGFEGEKLP